MTPSEQEIPTPTLIDRLTKAGAHSDPYRRDQAAKEAAELILRQQEEIAALKREVMKNARWFVDGMTLDAARPEEGGKA